MSMRLLGRILASLVLLVPVAGWANMPAPWAVCEGLEAGDDCGSEAYFPGGTCQEHPAEDCPGNGDAPCLWCESGGSVGDLDGTDVGPADDAGQADAAAGNDASLSEVGVAAPPSDSTDDSGCSVASAVSGTGLLGLLLLALMPLRRRRA